MYRDRFLKLIDVMANIDSIANIPDDIKQKFGGEYVDETLDDIESYFSDIVNYPMVVSKTSIRININKHKTKGDQDAYQSGYKDIDQRRRDAHEKAIKAVNVLARWSREVGCPIFDDPDAGNYTYDPIERSKVSDLCFEIFQECSDYSRTRRNTKTISGIR